MSDPQERMMRITGLLRERYGEEWAPRHGKGDPFKVLVGCVLSQRTRDANSERAAEALFSVADTPEGVLNLKEDELQELIRCSGFYKQKAGYITSICEHLVERFRGRVPGIREQLLSLPGVGPKTADIVLSYAFDRPSIAVDVHVARVARRLGLAREGAGPEEVKAALEGLTPEGDRRALDGSFVRLGKDYCRSRDPRCPECPLVGLCASASTCHK